MSSVLIVEDEKHLADGLRFNLEAENYQVEVVADGEAALSLLLSRPTDFDAVILDVMLPGDRWLYCRRKFAAGWTVRSGFNADRAWTS
ncbi:MAG: response regulator [Pyrinomonadaceae bacterium]